MICVTTSGGVKMAAPQKKSSMAYLRFFFKNGTLTIPNRARKVITRGNSKMMPKASNSLAAKPIYSFMEGMERMVSVAKLKKNSKKRKGKLLKKQ